jgi:phage-related holin
MWHRIQEWDWLISPKMLLTGMVLQPVIMLFERYIFADWQFLFFLFVLMGLDTVTGFIKHWLTSTISHEAFAKIAKKFIVYAIYLIVLHVLTHYSPKTEARYVFGWVEQVGYAVLVTREALSIITNLDDIHPGIIPGWFRKKLQRFHDTGKMEDEPNAQG